MDSKEIRELRERLGWTKEQMAAQVGVVPITIRRWETGKSRPSQLALRELKRLVRRAK